MALKLADARLLPADAQAPFRREVRLVAALDHPNTLPIKTAAVIDGRFVIVTALGQESLADRLSRTMALAFSEQLVDALAYAHQRPLISNFVGCEGMHLQVGETLDVRARDTVLATSDGLPDNLATEELIEAIRRGPLKDRAAHLAAEVERRMALPEGKPDDC